MIERLTAVLVDVNKEMAVLMLAMLPISELRGAIPLGLAMGFSPLKVYMLSFAGNMLPVLPLLFFMQPISNALRKIPVFESFFNWLFERTRKKAALVEKFEALGLMLFVAVPLPATGAWTGCMAATVFKIRFRYAFLSIAAGVFLAGLIVLGVCLAGIEVLGISLQAHG